LGTLRGDTSGRKRKRKRKRKRRKRKMAGVQFLWRQL